MLAAFFMQPYPPAFALLVIILDVHADHGRHAREAVNHHGEQGAIAQAGKFGHVDRIQQQRASSGVSTGVFPLLMTYLGPRTAEAGFIARMPPTTIQSNSIRIAARCCFAREPQGAKLFDVGRYCHRFDVLRALSAAPRNNRRTAFTARAL